MLIEDKKREILRDFSLIPDVYDRLGYLVEYGKNAPRLDPKLKIQNFEIEGCLSKLWIIPRYEKGKCYFQAESDSSIVNGISALICYFYNDEDPDEILRNNVDFLSDIGITQHLSTNRRNGLSKIVESITRFAKSCKAGKL